jgi:hypothetical protein
VTKQSKEPSGEQNKHEQAGTLNPGDQAPVGVEGTGENICRDAKAAGGAMMHLAPRAAAQAGSLRGSVGHKYYKLKLSLFPK